MNGVSIMISAPDLTTGDVLQRSADDYLVQEVSKLLDLVDSQKESCGTPVSISDSEPVDKLAKRASRSGQFRRFQRSLNCSLDFLIAVLSLHSFAVLSRSFRRRLASAMHFLRMTTGVLSALTFRVKLLGHMAASVALFVSDELLRRSHRARPFQRS